MNKIFPQKQANFIKYCKPANYHSDCFYKNTTNIALKRFLKHATMIVERIKYSTL